MLEMTVLISNFFTLMSNLNATKLESDDHPVSRRGNVDVDMLRQPGHRNVHRRHQRMTHNPGSSWDNGSTSSPLFERGLQ